MQLYLSFPGKLLNMHAGIPVQGGWTTAVTVHHELVTIF